jgi:DNA-binding transcriptional MerR regulator
MSERHEQGYRGPQVCTIVGITYRQLDYWARTELLRPSITEARGSGSQRRYSYTDLVQLKVIKRLLDAGISLKSARRAIDCLRDFGDDLTTANLVIDDGRSVLAHTGEEIIDLLAGGPWSTSCRPPSPRSAARNRWPQQTPHGRSLRRPPTSGGPPAPDLRTGHRGAACPGGRGQAR